MKHTEMTHYLLLNEISNRIGNTDPLLVSSLEDPNAFQAAAAHGKDIPSHLNIF